MSILLNAYPFTYQIMFKLLRFFLKAFLMLKRDVVALIVDAEHVGMAPVSGKLWVYWIGESQISLVN